MGARCISSWLRSSEANGLEEAQIAGVAQCMRGGQPGPAIAILDQSPARAQQLEQPFHLAARIPDD